MNAHDRAERVERLLRGEPYSRSLDIRLVSVEDGAALLEMVVTGAMVNDKGTCHGGALFTLADVAFGAAALHSHPVVTVSSDLHFLRPGRCGDTLRAAACRVSRTRRSGLFQVTITDAAGETVAAGLFKGQWLVS